MKGFERDDQLFSLCGLNCGLCPMGLGGHCGGCGKGNQTCKIARCSLEHGAVAYCFHCPDFPCGQYEKIDDFDSFITHKNRRADMERAQEIGLAAYREEQREKAGILELLLAHYNDGRRKTFFCQAVNLLPLPAIRDIMAQLEQSVQMDAWSVKERSAYAVKLFQAFADQEGISLKLRKKQRSKEQANGAS